MSPQLETIIQTMAVKTEYSGADSLRVGYCSASSSARACAAAKSRSPE